jgi:hypothetical protein
MSDAIDARNPRPELIYALGRYLWATIQLEDWARAICELAEPAGRIKEVMSRRSEKARAFYSTVGTAAAISARTWLADYESLLETRHAMLHGSPGTMFYPDPNGAVLEGESVIYHVPHKGNPFRLLLTPEAVDSNTSSVTDVLDRWRNVMLTVGPDVRTWWRKNGEYPA